MLFRGKRALGDEAADGRLTEGKRRGRFAKRCLSAFGALAVTVDGNVIVTAKGTDTPPCPACCRDRMVLPERPVEKSEEEKTDGNRSPFRLRVGPRGIRSYSASRRRCEGSPCLWWRALLGRTGPLRGLLHRLSGPAPMSATPLPSRWRQAVRRSPGVAKERDARELGTAGLCARRIPPCLSADDFRVFHHLKWSLSLWPRF